MKKEKGKENCHLKVVVPVVVLLGQAFLSNLDTVDFMKPTFYDLFPINIFIISNMNRIMHDPSMKFFFGYMTSLGISSQSHIDLNLGPTMECDFVEWMIWAQQ